MYGAHLVGPRTHTAGGAPGAKVDISPLKSYKVRQPETVSEIREPVAFLPLRFGLL
jgi:hypothetical protein